MTHAHNVQHIIHPDIFETKYLCKMAIAGGGRGGACPGHWISRLGLFCADVLRPLDLSSPSLTISYLQIPPWVSLRMRLLKLSLCRSEFGIINYEVLSTAVKAFVLCG